MSDAKKPHIVDNMKKILNQDESLKTDKPRGPIAASIRITGNGNHQIIGGDLIDNSIHLERLMPPKVIVRTGEGVLDAQQKRKLLDLARQVVETSAVKRKPRTYESVMGGLKRHMKVNSYAEIKTEDFDKAVKWLTRQRSIYMARASAPKKITGWRSLRIASIQAVCNEFGLQDWRKEYMRQRFGKESMNDLDDLQLDQLYHAVHAKKKTVGSK